MTIQTIDPGDGASKESGVTASAQYVPANSLGSNSNVIDSITLSRNSVTGPPANTPEVPNVALLGLAAGGIAGGAYLLNKKHRVDELNA